MTYCNQPEWLSAYTYAGVRQRLLDENPGFKQLPFRRKRRPAQVVRPLVHVVATLNLTKRTGSIDYVTPLVSTLPPVGPTGHAELVVRDAGGRELFRQPAAIRTMTDIPEGEDQTALVDAALPFRSDMAEIDLVLDGAVLARYKNAQTTPPAPNGFKVTREPDKGIATVTWGASPAAAGKVTFLVQAQASDGQWKTIAVGLTEPKLTLLAEQTKTRTVRVSGSNGFRSSRSVVVNLCLDLMERVHKLQGDLDSLQEGITRKELPTPPRTPQRIAQASAQLRKLRRDVAVAKAQLARCQKQMP